MFRITSLILGIFFSVGFVSSQTNETVPPASPRPPNLNPPPRSTSSPPPPVATPNQSPPPSVPPPAVIPNQLSPPNVPPPPLSSFCPIYLAQIVTYCGADVYSENANFSAPSCCGSVYQANQGSCFSTVVAPCTVSSSTLNGLTFICGLAYSQLYLPQGSVCVPPPSPQSPPEISPPFSPPPLNISPPPVSPTNSTSDNSRAASNFSEAKNYGLLMLFGLLTLQVFI